MEHSRWVHFRGVSCHTWTRTMGIYCSAVLRGEPRWEEERWHLIGCDAADLVVTGSHVRSRERDTPAAPKTNHSRESTSKHSPMPPRLRAGTGTAWGRRQFSSLYLSAGHSGGPRSTQMFLNNQYSLFHRNIWEARLWPPLKKNP